MPVSREERTIVRIAIGFGLLLGWLDTLMRGRDALSGLVRNDIFPEGNALPAFVFLAAHIFSFLAVAVAARSPGFLPRRRFLQLSGGILALAFPLAASLGSLFGEGAILFASGLSGAGTAFLVGGWAAAFCTLPRQEAALAYALAAFFAVLSVLYASAWNGAATLLPFAGPVVSALLLFTAPPPTEASGTFSEKVDTRTLRPGRFATVSLTTAYILYGLGSGMFSLLTSTLSAMRTTTISWPGAWRRSSPSTSFRDIPGTSQPFLSLLSLSRGSELSSAPPAQTLGNLRLPAGGRACHFRSLRMASPYPVGPLRRPPQRLGPPFRPVPHLRSPRGGDTQPSCRRKDDILTLRRGACLSRPLPHRHPSASLRTLRP